MRLVPFEASTASTCSSLPLHKPGSAPCLQSLAVGPSEQEGMSRITMVVPAGSDGLRNLIKQVGSQSPH